MFSNLQVIILDITKTNFMLKMLFKETSNSERMPYLGPNTVFHLRNVVKKVTTFRRAPYQNTTSGGCQKGDVPPSVWGV
jgi:hypothetical protein